MPQRHFRFRLRSFDEIFKGEPCVVLCGIIKNDDAKTVKNNGKEPFQKALRSFS